ncbi:hypothetical protein E2C01_038222 [Portunus trituberculatus]|uniref:Uncharacterized protein n=1 Tax=Portunus trituberculatus TaxID=210409 RepID=A0A5B7FHY2_PORTR|nr:hypothetical protein [Portunus trituberculatus]
MAPAVLSSNATPVLAVSVLLVHLTLRLLQYFSLQRSPLPKPELVTILAPLSGTAPPVASLISQPSHPLALPTRSSVSRTAT